MGTTHSQSDRILIVSIGYCRSANKRHLALPVIGQTAGSGLGLALQGHTEILLFGQLDSVLKDLLGLGKTSG